jgi:hypothetical protein
MVRRGIVAGFRGNGIIRRARVHDRLIEFAFALDPVLGHAQVIQARRQPIIGAIAWQDLLGQRATERVLMRCDPRLNVIEPMVTFGDNKG